MSEEESVEILSSLPVAKPSVKKAKGRAPRAFEPTRFPLSMHTARILFSDDEKANDDLISLFVFYLETVACAERFRSGVYLVMDTLATASFLTESAISLAAGDPKVAYEEFSKYIRPSRLLDFEVCFFGAFLRGHFVLFAACNVQVAHDWSVLDEQQGMQVREQRLRRNRRLTPAILVFDSLAEHVKLPELSFVAEKIRELFSGELAKPLSSPGPVNHFLFTAANLPLRRIACPQQSNGVDCGFFMLIFLKTLAEKWGSPGFTVLDLVESGLKISVATANIRKAVCQMLESLDQRTTAVFQEVPPAPGATKLVRKFSLADV
jgi:hypothetical protein